MLSGLFSNYNGRKFCTQHALSNLSDLFSIRPEDCPSRSNNTHSFITQSILRQVRILFNNKSCRLRSNAFCFKFHYLPSLLRSFSSCIRHLFLLHFLLFFLLRSLQQRVSDNTTVSLFNLEYVVTQSSTNYFLRFLLWHFHSVLCHIITTGLILF